MSSRRGSRSCRKGTRPTDPATGGTLPFGQILSAWAPRTHLGCQRRLSGSLDGLVGGCLGSLTGIPEHAWVDMVAAWLVGGTPIGDWLDADARATGPGQRTGDRRRSRQSWEWWSGGLPMVVVDRAAEVLSAHLPFQTTVHWTIWCAQVERPMRAPLEDEHLAPESQDLAGTIISNEAQEGRADWRHENQSQAPKHAGRFDLPCREVNPGPDCVGMS